MLKDNLKALRESKSLTKKQVAQGVGINERAYIAYEYGERDVSTATLSKLADFYGVTTDYLLGRGKTKPDVIAQLCNEYNLNIRERAIVTAYIAMDKKDRAELIRLMQQLVDNAEQQEVKTAITKIEGQQMAVARTSDPERLYRPLPTEEQMASFTPVTPDMIGEQ